MAYLMQLRTLCCRKKVRLGVDTVFSPARGVRFSSSSMLSTYGKLEQSLICSGFRLARKRACNGGYIFLVTRQLSSETGRKITFFQKFRRVVRAVFLASGAGVWFCGGLFALGVLSGAVKLIPSEDDGRVKFGFLSMGMIDELGNEKVRKRMASIYHFDADKNYHKDGNPEGLIEDIEGKNRAFSFLWTKLISEDAFVSKFGEPLYCSPKCNFRELTDEELKRANDMWKVTFYVDGSKTSGLLTAEFRKVKTHWVPVSLQLETLSSQSHDLICSISGPLPNGISRFTHLVNES